MFVFVSDLFVEDYVGGGELTTEAIIDKTIMPVLKIHASRITPQIVDALKDRHWIFGNFSGLNLESILYCCKNLNYSAKVAGCSASIKSIPINGLNHYD